MVVRLDPNTAFYMAYTRAWELLLGTIVSLRFLLAPLACRLRIAVTLAEIGVIAYSSLRYLPQTPFPGLAALAPCVGSALVLVADESGKTLVGTVFPWWPVVFIGLITCSLCL